MTLIVTAPAGGIRSTNRSELYRTISSLLERHTRLRLHELEGAGAADRCGGRLGCLVLESRPDFDPVTASTRAGAPAPAPASPLRTSARWLLLVALAASPSGPDRATVMLVDTDRALEVFRPEPERFEEEVFRLAVASEPPPMAWSTPADVALGLEALFVSGFPPELRSGYHRRRFGALRVHARSGSTLDLDGLALGAMSSTVAHVEELLPGRRVLSVQHPCCDDVVAVAEVREGAPVVVVVTQLDRAPPASAVRPVLLLGGAGLAAAGVLITAAAAVGAGQDSGSGLCIGSEAACPESFARSGGGSDAAARSGVLLAPLGASLALAGGAWAAGAVIDEDWAPWLGLGVGLAIGAGTYAALSALEPGVAR